MTATDRGTDRMERAVRKAAAMSCATTNEIVPTKPPITSVMASLRERGRWVSFSTRRTVSTFSATDAGARFAVLLMHPSAGLSSSQAVEC
jgi:hypothetical protein